MLLISEASIYALTHLFPQLDAMVLQLNLYMPHMVLVTPYVCISPKRQARLHQEVLESLRTKYLYYLHKKFFHKAGRKAVAQLLYIAVVLSCYTFPLTFQYCFLAARCEGTLCKLCSPRALKVHFILFFDKKSLNPAARLANGGILRAIPLKQ